MLAQLSFVYSVNKRVCLFKGKQSKTTIVRTNKVRTSVSDRNGFDFAGLKVGGYTETVTASSVASSSGVLSLTIAGQKQNMLRCGNDPSAGSPTETLLRLHLPLNDEV